MADIGIEKIIDCKVVNGEQYYQIKWLTTWEPASNLQACQKLIDDFWENLNTIQRSKEDVLQTRTMDLNLKMTFNNMLSLFSFIIIVTVSLPLVKTAFLQGDKEEVERDVYLEPTPNYVPN